MSPATTSSRVHRRFPDRPRVFLIFADLDGTFTPINIAGFSDFADAVRQIEESQSCEVKFIPVSGRPAGYVLRILHEVRDIMKGSCNSKVCDYGAAEQGALLVDSSRSYGPKFTGKPENVGLKKQVEGVLHDLADDRIVDEPDKLYTCSIHIRNEAKTDLSDEEQQGLYIKVRDAVRARYPKEPLNFAMSHNCLEIMTDEISKANAMAMLITRYQRNYNIVGLCYAGDAENDKIAMKYVSRLAEIPGINAHNFTPANAQEAISSPFIDGWKRHLSITEEHTVQKGSKQFFHGICELIRKSIERNQLCGSGVQFNYVRDDHCPKHLRRRRGMEETAGSWMEEVRRRVQSI